MTAVAARSAAYRKKSESGQGDCLRNAVPAHHAFEPRLHRPCSRFAAVDRRRCLELRSVCWAWRAGVTALFRGKGNASENELSFKILHSWKARRRGPALDCILNVNRPAAGDRCWLALFLLCAPGFDQANSIEGQRPPWTSARIDPLFLALVARASWVPVTSLKIFSPGNRVTATDIALLSAHSSQFTHLRSLSMYGCASLEAHDYRCIADLESLEELRLAGCPNLTHAVLRLMLLRLRALKALRLPGASSLASAETGPALTAALPRLTSLQIGAMLPLVSLRR